MLVTTTHTMMGKHVPNYLGVVNWKTIMRANIFKDFFAGIRDIVGG